MSAIRWTLRDAAPVQVERARAATLRLLAYKDQVATAATNGTLTLKDAGGTTIVTGATATDGTDTTFALGAGDTTTAHGYSTRWRAVWALTIGGETRSFEQDVWLVRSALYPVVTVADLTRRHRDITDLVLGGVSSIEGYLIEAWDSILGDLVKRGKRPSLIMESWALRSLLTYRALHLCFLDASTRFNGEDRFSVLSELYAAQADDEWNKGLRFAYDANEDGIAESSAAGSNVLVLTAGNMFGPAAYARAGGYR